MASDFQSLTINNCSDLFSNASKFGKIIEPLRIDPRSTNHQAVTVLLALSMHSVFSSLLQNKITSGQVRVFNVHIHSKLSGTGGKKGGGSKGGLSALAGTREYKQSDWNR